MSLNEAETEAKTTVSDGVESAAVDIAEEQLRTRIRDAAIEHIGRHGRKTPLRAIADAAGVSQDVLVDFFGSRRNLLKACDDHIADVIRTSKSQALHTMSPDVWAAAVDSLDTYAPMMAYLVRSLESGGRLGLALLDHMIDNAVGYLEDGVRAGTVKPSHDPRGRAKFLALNNAGGFLLYRRMHPTPNDMAAVLRDYGSDMLVPALEVYNHGVLVDSTMVDALVEREAAAAS